MDKGESNSLPFKIEIVKKLIFSIYPIKRTIIILNVLGAIIPISRKPKQFEIFCAFFYRKINNDVPWPSKLIFVRLLELSGKVITRYLIHE